MVNNYKIKKMNTALNSIKAEDEKRIKTMQAISSDLEGFESQRKEDLAIMLLLEPVYLLLCLFFASLVFYIYQHNNTDIPALGGFLCGAIFSLVFFFIAPSSFDKAFKNKLKDSECIKSIYKLLNIQKFDVNKDDSWQSLLVNSKLFAKFNETVFDDCFKGLVVSFDFNKPINADTIIKSKKDINIGNTTFSSSKVVSIILVLLFIIGFNLFLAIQFMTIFSNNPFQFSVNNINLSLFFYPLIIFSIVGIVVFISLLNNRKMQKVKLEDWDFDKRFDVLSTSQVEARYLITPSFMERLKSLETAFGAKNLKCSFFEDNIMFAISTRKDLFEFGSLYHSIKNSKAVEEVYNQIKSIQDMIKHFKLDEKTRL